MSALWLALAFPVLVFGTIIPLAIEEERKVRATKRAADLAAGRMPVLPRRVRRAARREELARWDEKSGRGSAGWVREDD